MPTRSAWPFRTSTSRPSEQAAAFLKRWYFWATHSRLEPVIDAARTVKRHWDGILRWFDSKIANGLIEGINSLVQAAKAKARGYRSIRNLKAMVYLLAGKLDMRLPAVSTFLPTPNSEEPDFSTFPRLRNSGYSKASPRAARICGPRRRASSRVCKRCKPPWDQFRTRRFPHFAWTRYGHQARRSEGATRQRCHV